jgi:hypothetical protein
MPPVTTTTTTPVTTTTTTTTPVTTTTTTTTPVTTTTMTPHSEAVYNNMGPLSASATFCSNGGSATQTFTVPSGVTSLTSLQIYNDTWPSYEPAESENVNVEVNGNSQFIGSVSLPGNTSQEKSWSFNIGVSSGDTVEIVISFNSAVGKVPDLFVSSGNPTGSISYSNGMCSGRSSGSSSNPTLYGQVWGMAN